MIEKEKDSRTLIRYSASSCLSQCMWLRQVLEYRRSSQWKWDLEAQLHDIVTPLATVPRTMQLADVTRVPVSYPPTILYAQLAGVDNLYISPGEKNQTDF